MARIIELKWDCSSCTTKNILGRHKVCPSCGSPREKGEMKGIKGLNTDRDGDGYNDAATVTDPALLKLAKAGADWFCTHCNSGNIGRGDTCKSCGAPRYGEKEENHPDPKFRHDHIGAAKPQFGEGESDEPSKEEILADRQRRRRKRQRGEAAKRAREERQRRQEEADEMAARARRDAERQKLLMAGGGGALLLAILAFFIWGSQTYMVEGSVTEMTWTHNTHVHSWKQVKKEDWKHRLTERPEIPPKNGGGEQAGVKITSCQDKHYEDERYVCGTEMEDYECGGYEDQPDTCYRSVSEACGETCSDNGNGFASCTTNYCSRQESYSCTKSVYVSETCQREVDKYCTRPIYKPYCKYKTQHWEQVNTLTASGTGVGRTRWETPDLGPLQKSTTSAKYRIKVSYTDRGETETYTHKPAKLSRYEDWKPGEKVTLERRNWAAIFGGSIKTMHHGTEKIDMTAE